MKSSKKSSKNAKKARGGRRVPKRRTIDVAKPQADESKGQDWANALLESQEIVDLRDLQSAIQNSLGKEAVTNEQRALQALGRLFAKRGGKTHKRDQDGGLQTFQGLPQLIPGEGSHLGDVGRGILHAGPAFTSSVPPVKHMGPTCAMMQKVSHPKETDLVGWSNWGIIDAQSLQLGSCCIRKMFYPTNSYEISSAVRQAEADGRTIRALGSGWSFSDAVLPQESDVDEMQRFELATESPPVSIHFGYAVHPDGFTSSLQHLLPGILRANVDVSSLFFVEAGRKLSDLNDLLNAQVPPVALKTLGGSDGQRLGGAISTGVHGSDYDRSPLADSVRAIYLVGAGGVHHWIEPASRRITDLAKIEATFPCIKSVNCHYDDEMFNAALVSMGSMGVVYAVVLDVVEQYALVQFNMWSTWEKILADSAGDLFQGLANGFPIDICLDQFFLSRTWGEFPSARSLQILINPIYNGDGTHNCYTSIRFEVPLWAMPAGIAVPSGVQPGAFSSLTDDEISSAIENSPECGLIQKLTLSGAQLGSGGQLEKALNLISFCKSYRYFWAIRAVIDLVYQKHCPLTQYLDPIIQKPVFVLPQIDIGYNVMAGGTALGTGFTPLQISSLESAFSFQQAISYVNNLLASFDAGINQAIYPAGYLSLRACGRTDALLGIQQFGQQGGSSVLADATGMVELSLLGNSDDFDLIKQAEQLALSMNGILHWGQSNGLMNANDVKERFPNLPAWQAVQQKLGGSTFTNLFMKRCGLA